MLVCTQIASQSTSQGCRASFQVLQEAAEVDRRAEAGEDIGPLCGLAVAVKDNIDVAGYPNEAGTPALQGNTRLAGLASPDSWIQLASPSQIGLAGLIPPQDAPLIRQLRAANGVVLGKTRMHELAEGYTSISSYYGPVLNPYGINMHVGGIIKPLIASVA